MRRGARREACAVDREEVGTTMLNNIAFAMTSAYLVAPTGIPFQGRAVSTSGERHWTNDPHPRAPQV